MFKQCPICGIEQPFENFYKDRYEKDGLYFRCKTCDLKRTDPFYKQRKEVQDQWLRLRDSETKRKIELDKIDEKIRLKNLELRDLQIEVAKLKIKKKHYEYKKLFGKRLYGKKLIKEETYFEMLELQKGHCAICGRGSASNSNKRLAIDHNHKTGQTRALLCSKCNMALGSMEENINFLESMISYIKYYNNQHLEEYVNEKLS